MQLFEYINLELARGFNNRIQLRPSRAEIKTKILFLAADPAGVPTKPLRLDREARLIKETIRSSKNQQRVDLETCWDVHSEDLSREMINHAPSIVHFGMHGGFGKVALSSHNRVEHLVTAEALLSLFKVFNGRTKLVVLSVCKSRSLAEDLANYVDCVIGMDGEIRDDSALIYSRGFYRGIAAGHSVQHAHELGKAELQIDNRPDADLPALACRRGVDPSTCCLLPN
jgi:hypothetical protein